MPSTRTQLSTLLTDIIGGYWGEDAGASEMNVQVVRNGDVTRGSIDFDRAPLRGVSLKQFHRASIKESDLVITTSGDCGKVAYVDCVPTPSIPSNFVKILRVDEERILPKFLYYFLSSKEFEHLLPSFVRGTTMPNLSMKMMIENVSIWTPSIKKQRRIVAILDKACNLKKKIGHSLQLSGSLPQADLRHFFGDLNSNPRGLDFVDLANLISTNPQNGIYKPASMYGEGVRIIRINSFNSGGRIEQQSLRRVMLTPSEVEKYRVNSGDILINRVNSRTHLGKSVLVPDFDEPIVFESNMMKLSPNSDCVPEYLIQVMQTQFFKSQVLRAAKDAINQSSINQTDVRGFKIPIPSQRDAEGFKHRLSLYQQIESSFNQLSSKSNELIDTFIGDVMNVT